MTLTVGSLFSGIGGFDLAFERAGFDMRWQVEIMPSCQTVLRHHWPDVPLHSDVCEVGAHNLEPVDIITFGSPCQDLSVAGKRAGLEGARSGLFFEAIRIIRELRPRWAVWENVPGALSSHHGRDFAAALDALADCGALDIGWRILDAQHFGVPQRRRRVFVVADFGGQSSGQILFESEGVCRDSPPSGAPREDLAGTLGGGAGERGWAPDTDRMTFVPVAFAENQRAEVLMSDVVRSITNGGGKPGQGYPAVLTHALTSAGSDASEDGTGRGTPLVAFSSKDHGADAGELSPTLRAMNHDKSWENGGGQVAVAQRTAVRRLTPLECSRLQGFPDDWLSIDGLSDSAKYRVLGNAVAVPVVQWIAERMAVSS